MNQVNKYRIETTLDEKGTNHQCTMSYQRMTPNELKNLDELHRLYDIIIKIHEGVLKENKHINSLETKFGVNFKK